MNLLVAAAVGLAVLWSGAAAHAQAPLYHGSLQIRTARGTVDRSKGTGSLRVNNWDLVLVSDSNGIFPDREPVIIAIGETERLVIPAGELKPSKNGKQFTFRNPKVDRGVRFFQIRQLKTAPGDTNARYRVRFNLVGIDLSGLLIEYPLCKSLAVIVGDDDGFEGVWFDRPGGFNGHKVKTDGTCPPADWPWV
jgi:hypothetical protein